MYLYMMPRWFKASKLVFFGQYITNEIFTLLEILGIFMPIIYGLGELIVYVNIRKLQAETS